MNNTFNPFRAALLSVAFVALSSTAAFGQLQGPGASDSDISVKNAVSFEMLCASGSGNCGNPSYQSGAAFVIPRGYRLVITQVAVVSSGTGLFELVGTLNGQNARSIFQIGGASGTLVTTHKCFVVLDSILSQQTQTINGGGGGTVLFLGYIVKG